MKTNVFLLCCSCAVALAQAPAALPGADVPDKTVVATVDGVDVTAGEVRTAVQNMPPEFTRMYQQNPKFAVQQIFMMRHLAAMAEKAKLGDESPLKEQLELMRANVLASAMVSREHNSYVPSQDAITEYYASHASRFQQAKVKAIMIAFKPALNGQTRGSLEDIARAAAESAAGGIQRSEADAQKLAADVVQQLRQGADFAKLVAQYSDDAKSKAAGGDIGAVSASSGQPDEMKRIILAANKGDILEPFRQAGAYFVFRVEDKGTPPLKEVYGPVVDEIKKEHVDEFMQNLSQRFVPTVKDPNFFLPPKPVAPGTPPAAAPPNSK